MLNCMLGFSGSCRDVTKEIRTPVDWIQMPVSLEPGGRGRAGGVVWLAACQQV